MLKRRSWWISQIAGLMDFWQKDNWHKDKEMDKTQGEYRRCYFRSLKGALWISAQRSLQSWGWLSNFV